MSDTQAGTRRQLRDLLATRARRTGEVTLSTGAKSNFYFDCKLVTLDAEGAYLAGLAFLDALDQLPERPDAVGGRTLGADPIVSAMIVLSQVRDLPDPGLLRPTAAEEPRHEAPHRESASTGSQGRYRRRCRHVGGVAAPGGEGRARGRLQGRGSNGARRPRGAGRRRQHPPRSRALHPALQAERFRRYRRRPG